MKSQQFTVIDPQGIHARPASQLVSSAKSFQSNIELQKDEDKKANVKSVLSVMAFGLKKDDVFTLTVEGEDEETAFATITETLTTAGIAK